MAKKRSKPTLVAEPPKSHNFLEYYHYTLSYEEMFNQFININYAVGTDYGMTLNYIVDDEHILSVDI